MSLRKRDLGFIIAVGGLLFVLNLNIFRDKPESTPDTDRHRPLR